MSNKWLPLVTNDCVPLLFFFALFSAFLRQLFYSLLRMVVLSQRIVPVLHCFWLDFSNRFKEAVQ